MNALLPIFVIPPNLSSASSGDGVTTGPLGQESQGPSKPSSQTFAQAFSQVLHEQSDRPGFFEQLHTLIATRRPQEEPLPKSLLDPVVHHLQGLVNPESVENLIGKIQTNTTQELPPEALSFVEVDPGLEIAALVSPPSTTAPIEVTHSSGSKQDSGLSLEPIPKTGIGATIPHAFVQSIQAKPIVGFQGQDLSQQGQDLSQSSGNSTLGNGQSHPNIEGRSDASIGIPGPKIVEVGIGSNQGSLLKGHESGVPSQASQEVVVKQASLGGTPEKKVPVSPAGLTLKEVPHGLQQLGRFVVDDETPLKPHFLRPETPLARSVQPIPQAPVTTLQAEGPAGFSGQGQTNPVALKTHLGYSTVLGEGASLGFEHQTTVTTDGVGESGLMSKGERASSIPENSVKGLVIEASNGQGLGSGMNHFSNSQSGFQQSGLLSGQGVGLRAMEERAVEFPAQALQRLQMDVQLSDNQRVMIDVGVQNKQVYAGLVMDHAILRNLANQFVPQLEAQLSQVDLELQEFSAEVREDAPQGSDRWRDDFQSREGQPSERLAHDERPSTEIALNQRRESGLHLLA
ncbi:MAG: hypothetical protein OEY57_03640 [Nitrospirota bacterium]|nr:hypothetical protein [Nitrospirota bacterium]